MFKPTLASSGAIVIRSEYYFADTTARDAYFTLHPTELIDNVYVYITGISQLQQYKVGTTTWYNISPTIKGETGATGATGATGSPGNNGKTWYYGDTTPSVSLGVNGDFYLNTETEWYYIKISGAWVAQACLLGSSTGGVWGEITGSLIAQLDLQAALDGKVPTTRTINNQALSTNITIDVPTELSDLTSDATHRIVTDDQINLWTVKQDALGYTPEDTANKGIASGYPPLNESGKIPSSFITQIAVTSVFPTSVQPLSPTDGTVWINTDDGTSKIYSATDLTWYDLGNSAGYVTSVNGHNGPIVSLTKTDLNLGNVVNLDTSNASNITSGMFATTVLPIATGSTVGVIKPGDNVTIEADGTLNVTSISSVAWGDITGTVSSQEDLQDALDGKANAIHNHDGTYQPVDLDLSSIAGLTGSLGYLKKTAANTWELDTDSFATVGALDDKSDVGHLHTGTYQPIDGDLGAIAALDTTGYLKRTGTNVWVLDESISGGEGTFATYGTATVTSGYSSVEVTHGYGSTPMIIETAPDCTISDVGETTFTLGFSSIVGENTDINWVVYAVSNGIIGGGSFS